MPSCAHCHGSESHASSSLTAMSRRASRDPGQLFAEPEDITPELIETLIRGSERVLVKKLANNDRNWAVWDDEKKRYKSNQAGVLLPAEARKSNFFPPLVADPDKAHNRSADIKVFWPSIGKKYDSRFIWYSGKGASENHWTTNPRSEFSELSPASLVMLFKSKDRLASYTALTIDSADDLLLDYIDEIFGTAAANFSFGILESSALKLTPLLTVLQELVAQLVAELSKGPDALAKFVGSLSKRQPKAIAAEAYVQWQQDNGGINLNPYSLPAPGDVLYDLSRQREFAIYKRDEAAYYGPQLVHAIFGSSPQPSPAALVTTLIENFDEIYKILLSAGQTRKSRAGGSFELHVERMLKDGDVPHFPQPIFEGRKPDFVLPSDEIYNDKRRRSTSALILTLKTTLRERWTQVVSESTGCPIFLATLDQGVPKSTLDKLGSASITLVVPETFKTSKFSEYRGHKAVVSFKQFFEELRVSKEPLWAAAGLPCFRIQ